MSKPAYWDFTHPESIYQKVRPIVLSAEPMLRKSCTEPTRPGKISSLVDQELVKHCSQVSQVLVNECGWVRTTRGKKPYLYPPTEILS